MRILGLDPGLNATGYGVIEFTGSHLHLIEGGVIVPPRSAALSQRLSDLQRGLDEVLAQFAPQVVVVEEIFSRTAYPRAAILMAHARGALVCAAAERDVPVFDYSATAVKRALVGNGLASKERVAAMVVEVLRLRKGAPDHVTDALALAIVHARRKNGRSFPLPTARRGGRTTPKVRVG